MEDEGRKSYASERLLINLFFSSFCRFFFNLRNFSPSGENLSSLSWYRYTQLTLNEVLACKTFRPISSIEKCESFVCMSEKDLDKMFN